MLKNGGLGDETAQVLDHDELQRQDSGDSSGEEAMQAMSTGTEEVNPYRPDITVHLSTPNPFPYFLPPFPPPCPPLQ